MLVVSNTSPISNLAIIGKLDLLRVRYGRVLLPECVKRELAALSHPAGRERIDSALTDGWLEVRSLAGQVKAETYARRVDPGEAEAIALAEELRADKLLIDDRLGRELARERSLPIAGLLGELLHAKWNGRLASLRNTIDELKSEARFFIRDDLREMILREAGE